MLTKIIRIAGLIALVYGLYLLVYPASTYAWQINQTNGLILSAAGFIVIGLTFIGHLFDFISDLRAEPIAYDSNINTEKKTNNSQIYIPNKLNQNASEFTHGQRCKHCGRDFVGKGPFCPACELQRRQIYMQQQEQMRRMQERSRGFG